MKIFLKIIWYIFSFLKFPFYLKMFILHNSFLSIIAFCCRILETNFAKVRSIMHPWGNMNEFQKSSEVDNSKVTCCKLVN